MVTPEEAVILQITAFSFGSCYSGLQKGNLMAKFGLFGSGMYGEGAKVVTNPVLVEYEGDYIDYSGQDIVIVFDNSITKQAVIRLAPGQSVKKITT